MKIVVTPTGQSQIVKVKLAEAPQICLNCLFAIDLYTIAVTSWLLLVFYNYFYPDFWPHALATINIGIRIIESKQAWLFAYTFNHSGISRCKQPLFLLVIIIIII